MQSKQKKVNNRIFNKYNKKELLIKGLIFATITLVLAISLFFSAQIETFFKFNKTKSLSNYNNESGLKVSFIDVGQGDATFVRLPDGKNMLIDSGPKENLKDLQKYFDTIGFNENEMVIDYVIATHPHADHIDNMPYIFNKYKIKKVYLPKVSSTKTSYSAGFKTRIETDTYANLLNTVEAESCEVAWYKQNEIISGTSEGETYEIKFWTKHEDKVFENLNNISPIITINYKTKTFCLTGDAEKEVEDSALNTDLGNVDVYKAGHHGSSTSTSADFLNKIKPSVVVISVGKNNSYGHPTKKVLGLLESAMFVDNIYRTDKEGTILFVVNSNKDMQVAFSINKNVKWYAVAFLIDVLAGVIIFSVRVHHKEKKVEKIQK